MKTKDTTKIKNSSAILTHYDDIKLNIDTRNHSNISAITAISPIVMRKRILITTLCL